MSSMQSVEIPDEILKTDRRGRVRVSPERREMLLAEFDRSGATAAAFAKSCGINYQTFAGWVLKRRKSTENIELRPSRAQAVRFAEVLPSLPGSGTPAVNGQLNVDLPGGAQVCLTNSQQCGLLAALLRAMQTGGRISC